jgi:serine protease AprX
MKAMKKFTLFLLSFLFVSGYAQTVIDPLLREEMTRRNENERIEVIVIMKSHYDREQLNRRADHFVSRAERREFVVNALKEFAEVSQYDLRHTLSEMERSGMVSAPITLWISNALYFNATKSAIHDLAQRNDIGIIGYAVQRCCLPDGEEVSPATDLREITPNVLQVRANQVWDMGYKGEGVVVALIDSGVNYRHVDVADHLWDGGEEFPNHGYDVFSHDDDPMDEHGHGSHCAGIICGDGTAGYQTGMAPEARLMCVKCANANCFCNAANMVEGIQWAVDHGCDLFSMSLGLLNAGLTERELLRGACEATLDAGVVAAIAAGNEGHKLDEYPIPRNVRVPGSCPPPYLDEVQSQNPGGKSCTVCVGAVDYNDSAAYFTSHGPVTWRTAGIGTANYYDYPYEYGDVSKFGLIRPDVCAPGVDIKSLNYLGNHGYINMSGTSMATPCVAGCMALMLSKNNDLTPSEVCQLLEETAVPLAEGKSNIFGYGRVDVLAAVEAIPITGIRYQGYAVNDTLGNNNRMLNPGESVTLSLTLNNISDTLVSGVSAIMMMEDEHVTVTQDTVVFPDFAANETITVDDAFAFSVDGEASAYQKIRFRIKLFVDGELIGAYTDNVVVHEYQLEYGTVAILNDPNNDGFLNPGETADLRIMVDNVGNEIAPMVRGTLSTNSPWLTLNETEKSFSTIGAEMMGYADFNVTYNAATDTVTIPLSLDLVDADGRHTVLTFNYKNACKIIFTLRDFFNDGWEDNYLNVEYSDGTPSEQMTMENGNLVTYTRDVAFTSTVALSWHNGDWTQECSFEVAYEDGTVIYQNTGGFSDTVTFTVNCRGGFNVPEFCESVSIFPNPSSGQVTIQCAEMKQVEVFSVDGHLAQSIQVKGDVCQLEGLKSGVYVVRILKGGEALLRKLIIIH